MIDQDLYKQTMQSAVAREFPRAPVTYSLINRGKTQFPKGFADELRNQVELMSQLRLTNEELYFLTEKCGRYLDPVYLNMILKGYQYDPREVIIKQVEGDLSVEVRGEWARTIYWEVPLMATIVELYYKMMGSEAPRKEGRIVLHSGAIGSEAYEKGQRLAAAGCRLSEFGTRRRHSWVTQYTVTKALKNAMGPLLIGTSNVRLAMELDLTPQGTQAHEWYMYHAAKYGYRSANQKGLENWVKVYQGDLGIALTDTFTTKDFFRNFSLLYANQFRGVRHDSGDPFTFMEDVINHYISLNIPPISKYIMFSDSLDVDLCIELQEASKGRIQVAFGVGTHLSNDIGYVPLNIVFKLISAIINGRKIYTIKLSDVQGKNLGPKSEINNAIYELGI